MALKIQKKQHYKKEAEIPTASLADIVFLLLIFFLVTTSMNPDKGLGITLPPPGEQARISKEKVLSIYINAEGKVLIGEEIVPLDQLKDKIKAKLIEKKKNLVAKGAKNPDPIVSLITDVEARYSAMVDVLDKIKLAFEELKKEDPKFKEILSLATPVF